MSWTDQLQPASFRGVHFLVDGDTLTGGRRGPTHEFPYKDEPNNEDTGQKARTYKIAGYVIGDDYFAKRDAVIDALETKGSGQLIHPQYGAKTVQLKSYTVTHSNDKGREALINMTFSQEEDISYPSASVNVAAKINNQSKASLNQQASDISAGMRKYF